MQWLRNRIIDEFTRQVGTHDDPALYDGPAGDPGLCGPDSVSWKVNGDLASVALGGPAAIVLEILHPSVVAGVEQQSRYQEDPFGRARSTMQYVLGTTFGSTHAATELIDRVRRIHGHVHGLRPDGAAYDALDPELLAWVHTCIPWMVLTAYERLNGPLTPDERDRYLSEQAVIGRMGGADEVPESVAQLEEYVATMRPKLAVTSQTRSFIDFVTVPPAGRRAPNAPERALHRFGWQAGMTMAPPWAPAMTGLDGLGPLRSPLVEPYLRTQAAALRWAFGTPPYVALARDRAARSGLVAR